MKRFIIFLFFITPLESRALFGIDAGINEGMERAKGVLLMSTIVDELRAAAKDGKLDFSELDQVASRHQEEYRKLSLRGKGLLYEADSIKYMDQYNNRASKLTKTLRKTLAVYTLLCPLGPDSCGVAAQKETNQQLTDTNNKLDDLLLHFRTESQKEELEKVRVMNSRLNLLESLGGIPLTIYQGVSESIR